MSRFFKDEVKQSRRKVKGSGRFGEISLQQGEPKLKLPGRGDSDGFNLRRENANTRVCDF